MKLSLYVPFMSTISLFKFSSFLHFFCFQNFSSFHYINYIQFFSLVCLCYFKILENLSDLLLGNFTTSEPASNCWYNLSVYDFSSHGVKAVSVLFWLVISFMFYYMCNIYYKCNIGAKYLSFYKRFTQSWVIVLVVAFCYC